MRTPGGESASHIGLFVRIKLNQQIASSSGMCSIQYHKPLMRRLTSPPRLPETSKPSLDKIVKETDVDEGQKLSKEETTASTNAAVDGNGTDLPHNRPMMARQEAVVQCMAEIHANLNTDM